MKDERAFTALTQTGLGGLELRDSTDKHLDEALVHGVLEKLGKFNQVLDLTSRHRAKVLSNFFRRSQI